MHYKTVFEFKQIYAKTNRAILPGNWGLLDFHGPKFAKSRKHFFNFVFNKEFFYPIINALFEKQIIIICL